MQDGYLFSESIARNIAVDDGEIDKSRLLLAARIANIEGFIERLPFPDSLGEYDFGGDLCVAGFDLRLERVFLM